MTIDAMWARAALGMLVMGACSSEREDDDASNSKRRDAIAREDAGTMSTMPTSAEIAPWGFDLTGMNTRVDPGASFNEYANGSWLANHTIPADRTYWGTFAILRMQSEDRILALLNEDTASAASGGDMPKARDFFRAFCDSDAIDAASFSRAQPGLDRIADANTHEAIAELLADPQLGLASPIGVQVALDDKDPDRYIALLTQSGLGLPDRDHYLSDTPKYAAIRSAYVEHITRVLGSIGAADPASAARAVMQLETQIAQRHWPADKRRDRALTYNPRTRAELAADGGDFPWQEFLHGAGLSEHDAFVVAELDAVLELSRSFRDVPVATWAQYLRYHYLIAHAELLPRALEDEWFGFYGRMLNGQTELRARDRRAVDAVNAALGEAVGELYVARYFPEPYKVQLQMLVEGLRQAFAVRIRELPWMSAETKRAALKKLDTFVPKIGYPDAWTDYTALEVRPDDAFGNAVRARVWGWQRDLQRLEQPADRSEWSMTPQTVNASYNANWNEIVFPAAILQPPFFDPNADPAVNYGAIGAVIGHEMGHGFDDQGAKSDERGVLRPWWQPQDEQAFGVLVDQLIMQYDAYEPLPGQHVNGKLTVGENIGDLGGLSVAYVAYRAALGGKTPAVLDGFSGDQRFFLGWAQIWRQLRREESLRNLLLSDPHSPSALRVDGVVRNLDAFYGAFDVDSHAALWLDPEARVHIW